MYMYVLVTSYQLITTCETISMLHCDNAFREDRCLGLIQESVFNFSTSEPNDSAMMTSSASPCSYTVLKKVDFLRFWEQPP